MPKIAPSRPSPRCLLILLLLVFASLSLRAQSSSEVQMREKTGRLVLVLPFDNRSGQAALDWIGDSFPDTINQRLNSSGFLTITREDRVYALDHLGFPTNFRPTRATTIQIARTLDADYVVVGHYTVDNGRISAQARVLSINQLTLSQSLNNSNQLNQLLDVENSLAWQIAHEIDPKFNIAQQTFLSASSGVKLAAFENYIRGVDSTDPDERIKRLQTAVQESPTDNAALLALGKAQFAQRDYDQAAANLAKIPSNSRLALEAGFYLGLSRFNAAKYAAAESAFGFVASRLPLPEVVNNQGVAASRQGKDAVALFQRASTADPNDADYHYNLAVALLNRGDGAGARREIATALKLRPKDSEAADLNSHLNAAPNATGAALKTAVTADGFDPVPRIRRTYSEASFRQAAFQIDQMRALRLASLPPARQAEEYVKMGYNYLAQGLIPEAEKEFQSALSADSSSAAAHAGLAQVRDRSGNPEEARSEAQASLRLKPNAEAYLVLARLDLQANNLPASASDVSNALHLDPANTAALGLKQALQQRGQSLP